MCHRLRTLHHYYHHHHHVYHDDDDNQIITMKRFKVGSGCFGKLVAGWRRAFIPPTHHSHQGTNNSLCIKNWLYLHQYWTILARLMYYICLKNELYLQQYWTISAPKRHYNCINTAQQYINISQFTIVRFYFYDCALCTSVMGVLILSHPMSLYNYYIDTATIIIITNITIVIIIMLSHSGQSFSSSVS